MSANDINWFGQKLRTGERCVHYRDCLRTYSVARGQYQRVWLKVVEK